MEMERALYIAIAVDDDGVAAVLPLPPSGQHHHRSITVDVLVESLAFDFHAFLARLLEASGGGGLAPASAAAVAGLEKKVFHAIEECGGGVTECAICLQEFEDGEEVSVMPCSRGHEFHTSCITKWLGRSNSCPLCRRALPTAGVDGQ